MNRPERGRERDEGVFTNVLKWDWSLVTIVSHLKNSAALNHKTFDSKTICLMSVESNVSKTTTSTTTTTPTTTKGYSQVRIKTVSATDEYFLKLSFNKIMASQNRILIKIGSALMQSVVVD